MSCSTTLWQRDLHTRLVGYITWWYRYCGELRWVSFKLDTLKESITWSAKRLCVGLFSLARCLNLALVGNYEHMTRERIVQRGFCKRQLLGWISGLRFVCSCHQPRQFWGALGRRHYRPGFHRVAATRPDADAGRCSPRQMLTRGSFPSPPFTSREVPRSAPRRPSVISDIPICRAVAWAGPTQTATTIVVQTSLRRIATIRRGVTPRSRCSIDHRGASHRRSRRTSANSVVVAGSAPGGLTVDMFKTLHRLWMPPRAGVLPSARPTAAP